MHLGLFVLCTCIVTCIYLSLSYCLPYILYTGSVVRRTGLGLDSGGWSGEGRALTGERRIPFWHVYAMRQVLFAC